MNLQQDIIKKIQSILPEVDPQAIKLTRPDSSHGDYSTNVAMVLFSNKEFRIKNKGFKNPLELAQKIAEQFMIPDSRFTILEKVEAVAPGFINFFISKDNLLVNLSEILGKGEKYGRSEKLAGKKILIEFAHPNTHKEFHIGHLRNITVGESVVRILDNLGATTKRANYQGDVGLHVAKALFGIEKLGGIELVRNKTLNEKAEFLGKVYAAGSKAYEEDAQAKEKILDINKKIYSKDPEVQLLWEETRNWSLEYFDVIYKRMNSRFDRLYFESEVFEEGKKIVLEHIEDGIFEKSDGAVIFDGEKYGLHKRVFVTSEGNPTYEGKEMGLAELEYEEFAFDYALHVVGPEQGAYFKVVFKALELINPTFSGKEKHLAYGFVRLKEGKMSSRMGNVVSGEWLLDEAKKRISESFKDMDEKTLEEVAVGAVKYSMLKFGRESDIAFSFDESISLEGNSGPYIQYTYARTQSVLEKVKSHPSASLRTKVKSPVKSSKLETEETEILRMLTKFSEVVEQAGSDFAPNILCNYLFELCQKYNLFYQKHKIIGGDKEEFRLALTKAVGQVIKNGLHLLGIESPHKM